MPEARKSLRLFVCGLLAAPLWAAVPVNSPSNEHQREAAVVRCPGGRSLAVWNSYQQDGSSGAIVARWLSADAVPDGNEWIVNQITPGNQTLPDIAQSPGGSFLVVWVGPVPDTDLLGVWARLLDPDGHPMGNDLRIGELNSKRPSSPSVTAGDRDFLVAWEQFPTADSKKRTIVGRLVSIDVPSNLGPTTTISDTPTYDCRTPVAAHDPVTGRFKVAWIENRTRNNVRVRSLDPTGVPLAPSMQANETPFTTLTIPTIACTPGGRTVLAWDGDPNGGAYDDIRFVLWDANDQPLMPPTVANVGREGAQTNPVIGLLPGNGFLLVWQSQPSDAPVSQVVARRFTGEGTPVGNDSLVWPTPGAEQESPAVGTDSTGGLVIVWQQRTPDKEDWDILAESAPKTLGADFDNSSRVDLHDYALWARSWPEWTGALQDCYRDYRIDELDLWALAQQWLSEI